MSRSLKVAAVVSMTMAALLFAAMQHAQTLRASVLLHQLPSTARAILRIDTAMLDSTAAARTLLSAFLPDAQLSEIEAVCGLAPMEALSEVALWVRGPDDQPFQSIGMRLRGRGVDAATLAACHRALVERRGGTIVRIDGPAGPLLSSRDQQSAIAVIDDRTIVTGSVWTVTEAMEVQRGSAPALIERNRMATMWPLINSASSIAALLEPPDYWMSALARVTKRFDAPVLGEGAETIGLSVASGSADTVKLYIDFSEARLASGDAERIRSWLASPPETVEAPWTVLLESARVQVHGRTIELTVDVSSLSTDP